MIIPRPTARSDQRRVRLKGPGRKSTSTSPRPTTFSAFLPLGSGNFPSRRLPYSKGWQGTANIDHISSLGKGLGSLASTKQIAIRPVSRSQTKGGMNHDVAQSPRPAIGTNVRLKNQLIWRIKYLRNPLSNAPCSRWQGLHGRMDLHLPRVASEWLAPLSPRRSAMLDMRSRAGAGAMLDVDVENGRVGVWGGW